MSLSRGGIDYSKWDHLTEDDDDDDDSTANVISPRVTRLDGPSQITTSGDGSWQCAHAAVAAATFEPPQPRGRQRQQQQQVRRNDEGGSSNHQPATVKRTAATSSSSDDRANHSRGRDAIPVSWTANGGKCSDATVMMAARALANNDGNDARPASTSAALYWSQDRQSVAMRILLPSNISPKDLSLEWTGEIYSYENRHHSTGGTASFTVKLRRSNDQAPSSTTTTAAAAAAAALTFFQGDLPHSIHYPEDEDELDWEIDYDATGTQKYLHLTLLKASPMDGVSIQWKQPIRQVPAATTANMAAVETTPSALKFQQAWEEAHVKFREKVAKGEGSKSPPPSTTTSP